MEMLRVLIADDHAIVRRGLIQILKDDPQIYVAAEAGNTHEVFDALSESEYDVLVLDIAMPEGGGLDVLERLRRTDLHVAVLILTIYPEKQYARRAMKLGARGYLTKDSSPQELITAIHTVARQEIYISQNLAGYLVESLCADAPRSLQETLSNREYQVMYLLAAGKTITQIASDLALSVKTVSTYRKRILDKLGLETTADIIRYALENGGNGV
jgi:DNA-binding NarL/FixJ family response regulator